MDSATGNQPNFRSQGRSTRVYGVTLAAVIVILIGLHITYQAGASLQNQPAPQPTMQSALAIDPIFATLTAQATLAPAATPSTTPPPDSDSWLLDDESSVTILIGQSARLPITQIVTIRELLNAPYPDDLILSFWHQRDFPAIGGGRFSIEWRLNNSTEWQVLWQYIGGMSGAGLVTAPSFVQGDWEYIEVSLAPIVMQLPDEITPDAQIELRLSVSTPQSKRGVQVRNITLERRQLRALPEGFLPDSWRHSPNWEISPDQRVMRYTANHAGFHVVDLIPLIDLRDYATRDAITLTYQEQGYLNVGDYVAVQIRFELEAPLNLCPDELLQCYGQVYHWSRWETASASIVSGQAHLKDWQPVTLDLSPYASTDSQSGYRIQIRFVLFSQQTTDTANWAWRDVRINRARQIDGFSSSP